MPTDWPTKCLSELGEVNRGRSRHRPRYAAHLYDGPYPFIQTGDIKASNGKITSYQQTYSEAGLAQSRLWPSGTLCITIAANIAETGILTFPACFPDSVVGFVADQSKCEVLFIEYMFRHLRRHIQREASGSVQDNINLETLNRLEIPLPPLAEQRAIASILGSLDDKIELNQRMNETLESIAHTLFQKWFVEARKDELPKGWREAILGELIEFAYGKPLKAEDRRFGEIPVFGSNGQVGLHDEKLVNGPGIIVGRKGNPGVVTWSQTDFFPIDTTFYVVPKGEIRSLYFLYYALRAHDLAVLGADSAVPGLNRNMAYRSSQLVPPSDLLEKFDTIVKSLFDKIYSNEKESRTLAALRDTLLPKLLSGELRVNKA